MNVELTTVCYIEQDNKYLMMHRIKKKNDSNHDKWIGIGGHFELGESPEECILREVWEETGLRMTKFKHRGIITFVSDIYPTEYMHLFTCSEYTGTLNYTCNEGCLEWVDKNKLDKLNMWQGDAIFLKLLSSDHPFFSLKVIYKADKLVGALLDGREIEV